MKNERKADKKLRELIKQYIAKSKTNLESRIKKSEQAEVDEIGDKAIIVEE
ncbi:MAG: hypothetical protein RRZ24_05640 [Clostridia bacterium]